VFCRTKRSVDQVATSLTTKGFAAAAVHGDLGQGQRERAMRAFRSGKVDVLVATDVAARGLDVDDVTHVVNYECPEDEKAYLHRTGRTGRAGREGVAVTFVDWNDLHRWKTINETLHLDFPEPLETYSTSAHLYEALGIPQGVAGVLPRAQRERAGLEAEDLEDIGETGKTRSRSGSRDRGSDARSADGRASAGRSSDGRSSDGRSSDGSRRGGHPDGPRDQGPRRERARRRTRGGQPDSARDGAAGELAAAPAPVGAPALAGAPGLASVPGDGQAGHSGAASTGQASAGQAGDSSGNPDAPRRPRRRRPRSRSTSGQATAE
jgi:superfamily II DNA/RNA helicase